MKIAVPHGNDFSGKKEGIHLSTKAPGEKPSYAAEAGQQALFPLIMAEKTAEASNSVPPRGETKKKTEPEIASGISSTGMERLPSAGEELKEEESSNPRCLFLPGMGEPSEKRPSGLTEIAEASALSTRPGKNTNRSLRDKSGQDNGTASEIEHDLKVGVSAADEIAGPVFHKRMQKNSRLAAENNPPDLRNGIAGKQGQGMSASVPGEQPLIADETLKGLSSNVNDGETAAKPVVSGETASSERPEKETFIKYTRALAGQVHEEPQGRGASTDLQPKAPGQELFSLATEAGNRFANQKTHTSAAARFDASHAQAVIDQIIDAQKGMNGDIRRVRIILDPPNLGSLNLDILLRRRRMDIVMTADNAGLQQSLQSRAEDIRTALQRQDFKVEGFQVLLQDNAANQQDSRGGAMFEKRDEHRHGEQRTLVPLAVLPVAHAFGRAGESMGMVSIFV